MKKLFLFISVFALLVACKREEPNQPEAQYISFSQMSIENLMTAGFDNTITTDNLADFDVWGHNGAGVVFDGTKVEKQGDLWVCAEEKMWEPDQTYHFYAFAPADAVDNIGEYPNSEREGGLSNFVYTNAGDKDFIYAYATRTQGSLLKINADPVQLMFEHLLSRVQFTFKNSLSEGNIIISNVQITDAVKSAELNCGDVDMVNWVWSATSTGAYNFGNITTGKSWKGDYVLGNDLDADGNPIKHNFRSYKSIDDYVNDELQFLTNLYDFDPSDTFTTFINKLQGGNSGKRRYAEDRKYIEKVRGVYNSI
jgi:hypothetical protein